MFLAPSLIDEKLFTQCSDNKLRVVNGQGIIKQKFDVEFGIKYQQETGKYCGGQLQTSRCNVYSPITAGGHVYMQLFEYVTELKDNKVIKICEIPDLPKDAWDRFQGKLFQKDDELYMSNAQKIFKLVNNHPVFIKYCEYGTFCQFCDNVIGWVISDSASCFCTLNDDLSESKQQTIENDFNCFSFAQNGVVVISDNPFTNAIVFDLVGLSGYKVSTNQNLAQNKIRYILEIRECGLSLPDEMLSDIFGDQFVKERNQMYKQFRRRQQQILQGKLIVKQIQIKQQRNGDELMFVTPIHGTNTFFQCSNNLIRIIDDKFQEISRVQVDFDIRECMVKENYCDLKICTQFGQYYRTFTAGDRTYLQFFEYVCELKENMIKKVCEIPHLLKNSLGKFYGKLFVILDELYMTNYNQIYKLVNSAPQFIMDCDYGQFYQFCDSIINVHWVESTTRVVQISSDLSEGQEWIFPKHLDLRSFAQGGVAIFQDFPFTKAIVFDLVTNSGFKESANPTLNRAEIGSHLVLKECGLSLSDDVLNEIFGKDFVQKRDLLYKEWEYRQKQLK